MDAYINILLLGETGVGKSTFINSFANYIKCPTLEEALRADLECLIPTKFTITDEDYEEHVVRFGPDDGNEDHVSGNSSTQEAMEHVFVVPGVTAKVRIIDTPGVGDARGIEQDEKNIRKTVAYLKSFTHLNAVCFVLKPTVTILNEYFRFCVTHLFSCVEKTAGANVLFTFTNTRSTFYRPGETMTLLQMLLREIAANPPHVQVPFSKSNIFCVDNEAFRYLVAMRHGHRFTDKEVANFSESWKVSAVTYGEMLSYIIGGGGRPPLEPHPIINVVSAVQMRDRLKPLVKVLVNIYLTIARHQKYLTKRQGALPDNPGTQELVIHELDHVIEVLDVPILICKSPQCDESSLYKRGVYPQKCHAPCNCGIRRKDNMYKCSALDVYDCKICTCGVDDHKHVYYVGRHFRNPRKRHPPSEDPCISQPWFVEEMDKLQAEYSEELRSLQMAFSCIDQFLRESHVFGGSYEIMAHLESLIRNCSSSILDHIQELMDIHRNSISLMANAKVHVAPAKVEDILNRLYQMKLVGTLLSRIDKGEWEEPKTTEKMVSNVADEGNTKNTSRCSDEPKIESNIISAGRSASSKGLISVKVSTTECIKQPEPQRLKSVSVNNPFTELFSPPLTNVSRSAAQVYMEADEAGSALATSMSDMKILASAPNSYQPQHHKIFGAQNSLTLSSVSSTNDIGVIAFDFREPFPTSAPEIVTLTEGLAKRQLKAQEVVPVHCRNRISIGTQTTMVFNSPTASVSEHEDHRVQLYDSPAMTFQKETAKKKKRKWWNWW